MGYRTLEKTERAYKNMEAVCAMLNAMCETDTKYWVDVTYLDYGQNWKWTTILNSRGVQILCPRDWEIIAVAQTTEDLANITNAIRNGKYFKE